MGGPGTSTTGTLCASSTGTMNHTRAIEILDYTHDTRVETGGEGVYRQVA